MLKEIVLVGLGGGVGSIMRFLTSKYVCKFFPHELPLATFIVNVAGCLLIGLLIGISSRNNLLAEDIRLLLIVGFCGGFTTFSTFSLENLHLYQAGNYWLLAVYILTSVIFGIGFVWLGYIITK